jgi:hypothetical protein
LNEGVSAVPRSIAVVLAAAVLVGVAALVLTVGAFAIGRWSSAGWTVAWLLAVVWFVRATLRHNRRARRYGLPVASVLGAVFVITLAIQLAVSVRGDRRDAGETLAIASAALPFVALAVALTRRSAAAWFARRA